MAETVRAFQDKNVTLPNGLTIHYSEWPGPRPSLVLLHPSSGYRQMWQATANALGDRFHVYALDQRGHGDSGKPDGDYSAEEYAEDLLLFFQAVGIDRAIVAGQSLGGRVGMVFAAVHPDRIQGLGLVGGPHVSNFFPTRAETVKVLGAAHRMLESPTEFPSRDAALAYLKSARPRDKEAALLHRLQHNFVPSGSGIAAKYDKVRVAIGLAHMADDLRKYAAKTACPVAILRGTHSSELTPEQAKEIAGCWKNAAVIEVEGDYALLMENPAGLARGLSSFAEQVVNP
ncbi:MAG: alpha/beta hydrolase [Candidatus Rokuibacteriota bacterium]|nr:MAG: alpha/beta hydrolase [Candidatus Rokubacteria bacterium]